MKKNKFKLLTILGSVTLLTLPASLSSKCKDDSKPKEKAENFDEQLNKIKADVNNKKDLLAKNVKPNDVKFSNYDQEKYGVKVIDIKAKDQTLEVKFSLFNKKSQKESTEKVITISGFKKDQNPTPTDEFVSELQKITVDVENKTEKLAKDIKPEDLKFENYDSNKYNVKDIKIEVKDEKTISVKFKLENKTTKKTSVEKILEISGFKETTTKTPQQLLEEELAKVKVDVENKTEKLAKDIKPEDLKFEGFGTNYEISAKSVQKIDGQDKVLVKFKLKDTKNNIESEEKEITLEGFKHEATVEELLASELAKITAKVEAATKAKRAKDVTVDEVILEGYETTKYEIVEKTLKAVGNNVEISFRLKDKSSSKLSGAKKLVIEGFKAANTPQEKLEDALSRITVKAPLEKYAKDIKDTDLTFENLNSEYEISSKSVTRIANKDEVEVTYKIKEKVASGLESTEQKVTISGFKHEMTADELKQELDKVQVEVDKTKYAKDIKKEDLKFKNVDQNLEITDQKVERVDGQDKIKVTFKLKVKDLDLTSEEKTLEIDGFKHEETPTELLNAQLEKVTVDVEGKATKYAKDINTTNLKFENTGDTETYEVIEQSVTRVTNEDAVLVKFKLKDKKHNLTSNEKEIKISGFLHEKTPIEILDEEAAKVKVDVENKATKFAKDVVSSDLKFSNYEESKYEITYQKIELVPNEDAIIAKFKLKDKNGTLESSYKEVKITGFKHQITKDEFKEIVKNISYTNKDHQDNPNFDEYDADELTQEILKNKLEWLLPNSQNPSEWKKIADEGINIKSIEYTNSSATHSEINKGTREFKVTFEKDGIEESQSFDINCHKTDLDVIRNQEPLAQDIFEFQGDMNTYSFLNKLEELEQSSDKTLIYDASSHTLKSFNDLKFKIKSSVHLNNKTTFLSSVNPINEKSALFSYDKATKKITISYYLGKDDKKSSNKRQGKKLITSTISVANNLISKSELDEYANNNKLEYPDITNTIKVSDFEQNKLKLKQELVDKHINFEITEFTKNEAENKVTFKYRYIVQDSEGTKIYSEFKEQEFNDFVKNVLSDELAKISKVTYEEASTHLASENLEVSKFKLLDSSNNEVNFDSSITKEISIVQGSANNNTGTLKVKVTLKQQDKQISKEYEVSGFKTQATTFDQEYVNKLKVNLRDTLDKSQTMPSQVKENDIELIDTEGLLPSLTVQKTLEANDEKGTLKVTIKVSNAQNQSFTRVVEFNGLKQKEKTEDQMLDEMIQDFKNNIENVFKNINKEDFDAIKAINMQSNVAIMNGSLLYGRIQSEADKPLRINFQDKYKNSKYLEVFKKHICDSKTKTGKATRVIKKKMRWEFGIKDSQEKVHKFNWELKSE